MSENYTDENLDSIKKLCLVFDENEDGKLDEIIGYKKDAQGRIVEISIGYNGDGQTNGKVFFEYDSSGRITKKCSDKNNDGKIDYIINYKYNEDGSVSKYYDDNADGKIDFAENIKDGKVVIEDVRDLTKLQKLKEVLKLYFKK